MKKLSVSIMLCVISLLPMIGCNARALQTRADGLEEEFDALVPELLKEQNVPGVSIAVISGGRVVWSKGYGPADKSKGAPVRQETRFNIGSVSKTLSAWGVMTLVEKGMVDLDAPIDRYLKRWHLPKSDFDNSKVTVRRLLSHTAGLSVYPASASINGYLPGEKMLSLEESLSRSRGEWGRLRVTEEPGTRFQYTNGSYAVLQLLIEDVTGEPFADYMQRAIFKPLGMASTGYRWTPELQTVVATPYNPDGEAWPHYQFVEQASGGVYTTASDLAQLVAALSSNDGQIAGRGALKPQTVEQMIAPAEGSNGMYGLGYKIMPVSKEVRMLMHDGSNEGWRAIFLIHPQKGDGIVLLTNSDIGGKVMGRIVCARFARTTIDMSALCSGILRR